MVSKTNFLISRECGKNAWLKVNKPEIYSQKGLSSFEQNIVDTGNQIDVLARERFPGGTLVESRDDAELTAKLIQSKTPVIYQPVFATEKFITASDILVWNEDTQVYDLYEVKSSTTLEEDGGRKTEDYVIDMAFQKNVLAACGVQIGTFNLLRLNKKYVRSGEVNIHELFYIENFTEQVNAVSQEIQGQMDAAYELLTNAKEPAGYCDCIIRGKNSHCTTSWYSNNDLPEYTVHSISRINKNKLIALVDNKIFNIHDVPDDFELSDNQRRQVTTAQRGKEYIDREGIAEFLQTFAFPLAFLDYETYPCAIPKYDGYSPYQQIPFQFSLHIVEGPDSEPIHKEFIYTGEENPDAFFAQKLQEYLPKVGSVVVWNQKFEKGINKQIGERAPQFKGFMEDVNNRVVDLMIPFSGNTTVYDHPKFRGSASIKYVLPALTDLSYEDLDIREGGTASDTWNRIISNEYMEEVKAQKIEALKLYCCRDTLAMVKIWNVLREKASENLLTREF